MSQLFDIGARLVAGLPLLHPKEATTNFSSHEDERRGWPDCESVVLTTSPLHTATLLLLLLLLLTTRGSVTRK